MNTTVLLMEILARDVDKHAFSSLVSNIKIEFFEQDADNVLRNKVTVRTEFKINNRLHGIYFSVPRGMFKDYSATGFYVWNRIIKGFRSRFSKIHKNKGRLDT
jgi:hypothetical protein